MVITRKYLSYCLYIKKTLGTTITLLTSFSDFRVQDDFGGSIAIYNPREEMVKLAEKCTRILTPIPSYARVDIIWDNLRELAVSELELIEPELWFRLNPNAAQKLAHHVDLILSEKK